MGRRTRSGRRPSRFANLASRLGVAIPVVDTITTTGPVNTGRAFNEGICAGSNTPLFATGTTPTCPQDGRAGDFLYGDRNFICTCPPMDAYE